MDSFLIIIFLLSFVIPHPFILHGGHRNWIRLMVCAMNDSNSHEKQAACQIEAVDLHKSYKTPKQKLAILSGAHLKVMVGEMLGITGASGVGKSTLLHILGGLDHPDAGKVLFRGEDICSKGNGYLENFRNTRIGFVFQFFNLLGDFTALEKCHVPGIDRKGRQK